MIFLPGEQATVAEDVVFEGIGIHSGQSCRAVAHPAEGDHGIVFLKNGIRIPASPDFVTDTQRGTTLGTQGETVTVVEHLMAALAGCGVDNALIEVQGPEIPALDGSAAQFALAIIQAGKSRQGKVRKTLKLTRLSTSGGGNAVLTASPSDKFVLHYLLCYNLPVIGMEFYSFCPETSDFFQQVAPARTFGLAAEGEKLKQAGLALGASEDNTVIVYEDGIRQTRRFDTEFARHKILDMLGDLALVGAAVTGEFYGAASGHRANVEMARQLKREQLRQWSN